MAETIDVKRKKDINVVTVEQKPAPDIMPIYKQQFVQESVEILEQRLLRLGIIVPRDKLKRVAPAFIDIGKKYYEAVSSSPLF